MGKYFATKTCIYLDQFAVSNLSENETWRDLLLLLQKGIKEEKIFIPYSTEHLIESSDKDSEKAKTVDRLLFEMSGGIALESSPILTNKLLISAIRKRPINANLFTTIAISNILENESKLKGFKNVKANFNNMVVEGTALVNYFRDATRQGKKQDIEGQKSAMQRTTMVYQKELEDRLRKFSRYGFYDKKPIKFSFITIPFWADSIMDSLIKEYKITKAEAKKGGELLKKYGIKKILPPLYVRTILETMLAVKHQKETSNDHIDIIRLCSAIPFADMILTDKSKVYDIKTSTLDKEFDTEVYSGTKAGLAQFKNKLVGILE